MTLLKYRPEIDGLRAIAVSSVIVFHAWPSLLPGGFLGVDIFFVISGYLITSIVLRQVDQDSFRFLDFYERRARRLFPALFLVCLACLPFAWLWMMPAQLKDFGQSLVAVSLYASNFLFWKESDYFALAAEEKPLLHTWSLGVEEQFYLLFPVVLVLLVRFVRARRAQFAVLVLIWCISLIGSLALYRMDPSAAFYLLPGRAWQLLTGAILALLVRESAPSSNSALACVSLILLGIPLFWYVPQIIPIGLQLLAVLGAAGVIYFTVPGALVGRVLTMRPLVYLGTISYGAYLWHQPIFAFARVKSAHELSFHTNLALVIVTLIAAHFSLQFVERPIRKDEASFWTRTRMVLATLAISGTFIAIGISMYITDGFKNRFAIPESVYESIATSPKQDACFGLKRLEDPKNWFCKLGKEEEPPSLFVFGDSHLIHFLPALEVAADGAGVSFVATGLGSCAPLLGVYLPEEVGLKTNCHDTNRRVFDAIKQAGIKHVLLIGRWELYTDGGYTGTKFRYLSQAANGPMSRDESRSAFVAGVTSTLSAYKAIGVAPHFFTGSKAKV